MRGGGGVPLVSQVWMAWIRGPGFLRDRVNARLLVKRRPAAGAASLQRLLEDGLEVLDVLGEQPLPLCRGEGEHLLIGHGAQARLLGDGDDVVSKISQRGGGDGREHLVEEKPGGQLTHAMSCWRTRHACSARSDASSAAVISASISPG